MRPHVRETKQLPRNNPLPLPAKFAYFLDRTNNILDDFVSSFWSLFIYRRFLSRFRVFGVKSLGQRCSVERTTLQLIHKDMEQFNEVAFTFNGTIA